MDKKTFYSSKQWVKLAKYIRIKYYYVCQRCGHRGTYVHHIIPITNKNVTDANVTLNENNLTLLCLQCHNLIHMGTSSIRKDVKFNKHGQLIKKLDPPITYPRILR